MKKRKLLMMIFLCTMPFVSCIQRVDNERVELKMVGDSFLYNTITPILPSFQSHYGVTVSLTPIERAQGIDMVASGKADMAVIDGILTDKEMAKYTSQGIELLHIPSIIEIVGVSYNLNGVFPKDEPVYFTPELLYLIFTGEITRWNDSRIVSLNQKVAKNKNRTFPNIPIIVLGRTDGSGNYLNMSATLHKICPAWRERKIGVSHISTELKNTAIQHFITGGVALTEFASTNVGSIWFSDHTTTKDAGLSFGAIQNADGNFVTADISHGMNTIQVQEYPADLRLQLNYLPGQVAPFALNPLSVIVRKEQMVANGTRTEKRSLLLYSFLIWLLEEESQIMYFQQHYVPSPKRLLDAAVTLLNTMTYKGQLVDEMMDTKSYLLKNVQTQGSRSTEKK